MSPEELGRILNNMYHDSKKGETATMIHLFGVKYASGIRSCGASPKEIAKIARIPESYGTEINKGCNLARYVRVK